MRVQRTGLDTSGFYQPGDYVVPDYNENGGKLVAGQVVGDKSQIVGISKMMAAHALMEGAELLLDDSLDPAKDPTPGKKKKAKKVAELKNKRTTQADVDNVVPQLRVDGLDNREAPQVKASQPKEEPKVNPIEIVFSTGLGRIKLNAISVLDSDNALAIVLADEGEVRYEPAPGSTVQLAIRGKIENTMYPGFKFTWLDNKKQIMVFVKIPSED